MGLRIKKRLIPKEKRFLIFLTFLLTIFCVNGFSQKEGNWWYFGQNAGLDFNRMVSGLPTAVANGSMVTQEGCASISNGSGQLLFYTDGKTVWNRNHTTMPNGTGLLGNFSSTQSAVIVPFPGNSNKYYVFTIWTSNTTGFRYSVVDMTLNSGLGDIVTSSKNTLIFSPTCERITSGERTGGGFWVIAQHKQSNRYSAYAVTSSGVSATAVTTTIGPTSNASGIGYMKMSPKGDKIAVGFHLVSTQLFDFDKSTGILSNLRLDNVNRGAYGMEFSPDGKLLYGSPGNSTIRQYDAYATSSAAFVSSVTTLNTHVRRSYALQLGPDGKIYVSNYMNTQLSVIMNPNVSGTGCNFSLSGPTIPSGALCRIGFPTFVQSFFLPQSFQVDDVCGTDYAHVSYLDTTLIDSLLFNFGDPLSGLNNFSKNHIDSHKYYIPGKYNVTLYLFRTNGTKIVRDTLTDSLTVFEKPVVNIGNDTSLCDGHTLKTDSIYSWYKWSTGDASRQITTRSDGIYSVKAGTSFCYGTDSINISWLKISKPNLGNDTAVCNVDSFNLSSNNSYDKYLWSTTQTTKSIKIHQTGRYWIEIDSFGCKNSDTINVIMTNPPLGFTLGEDKKLCEGKSLILKPKAFRGLITWSTGDTSSTLSVNEPGTYAVTMSFNECEFKDEVTINLVLSPTVTLERDTVICESTELELQSISENATSIFWNNGSMETAIVIADSGNYWIKAENECGTASDTINIKEKNCECKIVIPNVFTPNNDNINDLFLLDHTCTFTSFKIDIYNRWGRLMFTTTDISEFWDGAANGKTVTDGVYFWVMNYQHEC